MTPLRPQEPEAKPPSQDGREPYQKPQITFTEITASEAIMAICKSSLGAGPYGPGCPGGCRNAGS